MSSPSNVLGSHAIVIGGGMAGLLSAHVLTNYFERVSGIEGMNPNWIEKLTYRYIDNVVKLLPTVPLASKTFINVLHMLEAPTALFHPAIVAHVLLSQTPFNRTSPRRATPV